ncbi:MAG: hypothetical protein AAFR81_29090 [Chloroflexota bacterium]
MADQSTLQDLLAQLETSEPTEHKAIFEQLKSYPVEDTALPMLQYYRNTDYPWINRINAHLVIQHHGDDALATLLAIYRATEDIGIRNNIAFMLQQLSHPDIIDAILTVFLDPSVSMHGILKEPLIKHADETIVGKIGQVFLQGSITDNNHFKDILEVLVLIGGQEAVEILTQAKSIYTENQNPERINGYMVKNNLHRDTIRRQLIAQAKRYYCRAAFYDMFTQPISEDDFLAQLTNHIEATIERVIARDERPLAIINHRFACGIVPQLPHNMPQGQNAVLDVLVHATDNLFALCEKANVITTPITQTKRHQQLRESSLQYTAEAIADGKQSLALILRYLPASLFLTLHKYIHTFSYDYEFGYKSFLESLDTHFESLPVDLSWAYDAEAKQIRVTIDKATVTLDNIELWDELGEESFYFIDDMQSMLAQLGWAWLMVEAEDQVAGVIVVPEAFRTDFNRYLKLTACS